MSNKLKAKAFAFVDWDTQCVKLHNPDVFPWKSLAADRREVAELLDEQHEASLLSDGRIEYSEAGKPRKRYPDKDTFFTAMALRGWELKND